MNQPPSTEKTGPQKGDVIDGKLQIEGVIAEGRTSSVVSAVDRSNGGRKVAVKVARGSDLEALERFKRGARGMQKLKSPYAVRVLGVGQTQEGLPCMTMEYLEGRTLAQKVMQSGPLPIDEATRWMLQVCEALAEAHAHKLLHRDLDAENLFLAMPPLGSRGEPSIRVLDFGLAPVWRLGKGDGRLRPGDVPGTSFAMAPELARGSDLDERVDIWGIGSCLFRLLTGKHAYNARNLAELCTRILAERPPDITKLRTDVPAGLAAVVKKCLEREPGDRYRSIHEVILALEATTDDAPLTPQVPTEKATLEQLREIERARDEAEEERATESKIPSAQDLMRGLESERAMSVSPSAIYSMPEPIPSSDDDLDAMTAVHQKSDLLAGFAKPTPKDSAPMTVAMPAGSGPAVTPKVENPQIIAMPYESGGEIGASTPHTMRTVPAFEAIANRLEPPKPKRSDPPARHRSGMPAAMPPPPSPFVVAPLAMKPNLELVSEDGPSTQPLGRLSPFAELPKAPPDDDPASEQDHTIQPVLIGLGPQPASPLPKPTPKAMNAETIPPPVGVTTAPLPRPSPQMMAQETMQALPKPSPQMMGQETITQFQALPNLAPVHKPEPESPLLVFQASPRVLDMGAPMPSPGIAPVMATPTPAAMPSGPPAPLWPSSGPPPAPMPALAPLYPSGPPAPMPIQSSAPSAMPAVDSSRHDLNASVVEPAPPSVTRKKSRLIVPLIFALGIAVSAVVGLYVARLRVKPGPVAQGTAVPSGEPKGGNVETKPSEPVAPQAPPPSPPPEVDSAPTSDLNIPGSATPPASATHRRHHTRPPAPAPTPSVAPVKSGNVYDPSMYDPR